MCELVLLLMKQQRWLLLWFSVASMRVVIHEWTGARVVLGLSQ
jgi:hypothetical protein